MGLLSKVGRTLFGGRPDDPTDPESARLREGGFIRTQARTGLREVGRRDAPQAEVEGLFRGGQERLIGSLEGVATGQEAGAGELAARRAVGRAQARQQAGAAGVRGSGAALAQRAAQRNIADVGVAGAGQAQEAALRDQQQARAILSQTLGQARGQEQQFALANMNAQLAARGMDDAQRIALMAQIFGVDQAEMAARLQQEQIRASQQPSGGLFGDLLQAGGTIAGAAIGGPAGAAIGGKLGESINKNLSGAPQGPSTPLGSGFSGIGGPPPPVGTF